MVSVLHLTELLVVGSSLCLELVLQLSLLSIRLHAAAAADEAADAEDDFDGGDDEEGGVLVGVVLFWHVVLVGQEWVFAVLHDGDHDEEVDADE